MDLSREHAEIVLKMLAETNDNEADCGYCLNHLAEYVETKLTGKTIGESLGLVEAHLEICVECCEEFEALYIALSAENL